MPDQSHPTSKELAPDPSNNYERSHPSREAGQGRMDQPAVTPRRQDDDPSDAVTNKTNPARPAQGDPGADGINHAQERGKQVSDLPIPNSVALEQPDHSMKDEEPTGWDQAPKEATSMENKRHPRVGGKGGTPDVGESTRNG